MFTRSKRSHASERLPLGAEAALWSIVEVIPDPRNHLALTRDPTAEVRLSAAQIEAVAAAPVPAATASSARPAPIGPQAGLRAPAPPAPPAAPTLHGELPPPPPAPLPPPPVPSFSSATLPSSVMARLRIAVLDWAADTPRAADTATEAPPGGPVHGDPDPDLARLAVTGDGEASRMAALEAALDGAVRSEIDLSEPVTVIVIADEPESEPIPVTSPIDEGVRELFRSKA